MPSTGKAQEAQNSLVQSFTAVRRALGYLGLVLPIMLLVVVWVTPETLQPSLSAYYYGAGGSIFVGTLCAIAMFLWSYLGYQRETGEFPSDKLVSRLAAASALLVAFVPVGKVGTPYVAKDCSFVECLVADHLPVSPTAVHFAAAGSFFSLIAVLCIVNFRRPFAASPTQEKRNKNRVFLGCGIVIVVCVAVLALRGVIYAMSDIATQTRMDSGITVFLFESISVWAFALAWLVKGETYKVFQRR